jgi:spoIIIJ-associated protein
MRLNGLRSPLSGFRSSSRGFSTSSTWTVRSRSRRTTSGSRLSSLIGKRGQTIDALQLLAFQAAFRGLRDRKRVVLDVSGYRERRREVLTARADRAAEQALDGNVTVEMDPMSAQERRVVHEHLKDRSGVETYSEGDEPRRCVVVAPLVSE